MFDFKFKVLPEPFKKHFRAACKERGKKETRGEQGQKPTLFKASVTQSLH